MNYLGLNGAARPQRRARTARPSRPAGQIADLGGGALMAAFGILAALRERDRSGEGQLVDVSMTDGALSWLAMVAARVLRRRRARRAAAHELLGGALVCYRPYRCADGWVTLGALEPKFWRRCAAASAARTCRAPVRAARARTRTREVEAIFARAHARRVGGLRRRARLLPGAGARGRRGAGVRAGARARDGRRVRAARRRAPVRGSACRSSSSRTPGGRARAAARRSASTPTRCCAEAGFGDDEIAALLAAGAVAGAAASECVGTLPGAMNGDGLLKMSELAERSRRLGRARSSTTCARGCCGGAGIVRTIAQHGLLPARLRRADPR